jgi:hypothetical protein
MSPKISSSGNAATISSGAGKSVLSSGGKSASPSVGHGGGVEVIG